MLLGMHCVCDMVGCPSGLPAKCVCGPHGFTVDHAMNCSSGGFPTLRHNELRDFTTATLSEVCHDAAIEPVLQPLSGESRLNVSARGFWGNRYQRSFFDVATSL